MPVSLADAPKIPVEEGVKRRQIIEGARKVFLAQGFDAASMGEIGRQAGVSKGTLYVYFENKERLFEAVVEDERRGQAEQVFSLDPQDHDVEAVLTRLGKAFVAFLCQPSSISPLRTVMSIAERMPEIGRSFYEAGPQCGMDRLAAYLDAQVAAGALQVEDTEVAAAQFLESCLATLFKPLIFNAGSAPTEARIAHVVGIAVRTFLAAYKRG
ncbi:MAG: TetR/AcrR family transcriptional regulator [Hyphomicrobium sp.]|jgi:AcrR family transcriptional regulator